jgi:uncharacterized protein YcnI
MAVRRTVGILAPLVVVLATATPAWAHPGVENAFVPVGRPANLVFDVPAEEPSPMVGVDILLPPDFTLVRFDQTPNWKGSSSQGTLHFIGGPVPQGRFVQFTFAGVFAKKEVLLVTCVIRGQDGSVRRWDGKLSDHFPAVALYPGYTAGEAPIPGQSSPPRARRLLILGGQTLVVAGALTLAGVAVARRRSRRDPIPGASEPAA